MLEFENEHFRVEQETPEVGYVKLLSFVMGGRNDNYQDDFNYRITTCLNFLARNLAQIGRLQDVEILVTDWGSKDPLATALSLSKECSEICRFLFVPEIVTKGICPDSSFSPVHAFNVGIRRAAGKFVAWIVADLLITQTSLKALFDVLENQTIVPFDLNKTLFLLHRFNISTTISHLRPSLDEWDRFLTVSLGGNLDYRFRTSPRFQWNGGFTFSFGNIYHDVTGDGLALGANGILMHSSIWHQCRGWNEELIFWGFSDVDLGLRITQRYQWIDLVGFGVWTFHMEHTYSENDGTPIKKNRRRVPPAFQMNDSNWGLGKYDIESQLPKKNGLPNSQRDDTQKQLQGSWPNSTEPLSAIEWSAIKKHSEWSITTRKMDLDEWERLCVISWYSLNYRPRNYLQVGIQNSSYALAVAHACPLVEIYDLIQWDQTGENSGTLAMKHALTPLLAGYPIYRRFVGGHPAAAFEGLLKSTYHSPHFDLVLANIEFWGNCAAKQLLEIVKHLNSPSAIVLAGPSSNAILEVMNEITNAYPHFAAWRYKSGRTGIIEAHISGDNSPKHYDGIHILDRHWGKPPLFLRGGPLDQYLLWSTWFFSGVWRRMRRFIVAALSRF